MIEGTLVRLRAVEVADAPHYKAWLNDREVIRHLQARYPLSLTAEEAFLERRTGTPVAFHDVNFAIETADGVHIGSVGLHFVSAEDRRAHLGILIGEKAYWSRGYGTDAIRTAVRFAFEEMNLQRVELYVDEDNARGIACYRKCGFVEEGRLRQRRYREGAYVDHVVMAVLRGE